MADYIYLLRTRLTPAQQTALQAIRNTARERGMTVFLVGGAVRDLTSGSPIRDLDVVVQGNATKLKKDLQKVGGVLLGEHDLTQALYFSFAGGVRIEVGSTLSVTFPKPGKPVYKASTILDDLRRRDFTANAMALSLNDGSYGLLMDPLNGVADIENRELRLVSNYGFIEDPVRMIRAARLTARLGWHLEEKTEQRYQTGKAEGYISAMSPWQAGYETEEIVHEEDPLRVMRRLESEGWSKYLFPAWTSAKVNEAELSKLRDLTGQLESMGIFPDPSAAYFPLITAKLSPKEGTALKATFPRPGFVEQVAALDSATKAFAAEFSSKAAAAPSAAWKMLYAAVPEQVLWLGYTSKSAPVQARIKSFFGEWSQARTKIPYQLMQEMRIVPELAIYPELLDTLFFAIMDGKLDTIEAAKAFLEPYSPPAPPPPVSLRRRAVKKEPKVPKPRTKKAKAEVVENTDDVVEVAAVPAVVAAPVAPAKPAKIAKVAAPAKPVAAVNAVSVKAPAKAVKAAIKTPVKAVKKVVPPAKVVAKKVPAPAKKVAKTVGKKPASKPVKKAAAKPAPKAPAKKIVAKKVVAKAVAKKVIAKPVAKKVVEKKPAPKPVAKVKKPAPKPVAKKAPSKKAAKRR